MSVIGHSQTVITGKVIDAETRQAIPGASVFLTNTTIGTIANENGEYHLSIPAGKFDVVFSSVGYLTRVITSSAADSFALVKLLPKVKTLDDIEIRWEKDGWEIWGRFFLDNFIGTTEQSEDCRLKNPGVLKFRHDKVKGELTVVASAPLIIENKALGYTVRYQLENFNYQFGTRQLFYEGFPFFEEMAGGAAREKRWNRNRLDAYEGSIMHFMRALFRNRLAAEGFEVHQLRKIRNAAKDSIRMKIRSGAYHTNAYDRNLLSQPDFIDLLNKNILPADSVAYAVDSVTAGLSFRDYLDVLYTKRKAPPKYILLNPDKTREMISQITLNETDEVQIQGNGLFSPSNGVLSLGYWAWSEKIATLLPLDYKPSPR